MTDISAVAENFKDHYYKTFDTDRSQLFSLYRPHSMLTFEGTQILGTEAIVQKLIALPFTKVVHRVLTTDAQPSHPEIPNLIVSVTGQLLVDDGENPLHFSQIFQLVMDESQNYYVFNDIFRLNYG